MNVAKSLLLTIAIFVLGFVALYFKEHTLAVVGILMFVALFALVCYGCYNYLVWGDTFGYPNRPFDGR